MSCTRSLGLRAGFWLWAALAVTGNAVEEPALTEVAKDRPCELRVLYLEDPRLPTLSAAQRAELGTKVEGLLLAWFGYRATLRPVGQANLAEYFTVHAERLRAHPDILAMDLDIESTTDRLRLRTCLGKALTGYTPGEIQELLQASVLETRAQAITAAEEHMRRRLREIRAIPLAGGGTFFDPARPELNSYMHWCALMYEMDDADLVLTNGMIAGADLEMEAGIIARGGITTGNTNANRHNAFGASAMVGLFPFLSDAPFWLRERGAIPEAERLDTIATMVMHELGHLLLRAQHPINHPANCVHMPAPRLRYYDWHRAIRQDGPCQLPHPKLTSY
jgi:hypothetical protein